ADARQLGRAIGNLIDNAIAATPRDGRILVALSRRKQGARIVISDNGAGMKPSEMARALDGYRIGTDGKPEGRRGGLGLPLARQLIEAHGGRLDIQSEKGTGTTVTITLPLRCLRSSSNYPILLPWGLSASGSLHGCDPGMSLRCQGGLVPARPHWRAPFWLRWGTKTKFPHPHSRLARRTIRPRYG